MSTALYLRVSTEGKLDSSGRKQTTENQELALKEWCAIHGILSYKIYADTVSGKDLGRVAYKQVMQDIASGEIDCVVVTALDRLTRSLYDFTRLAREFRKQGIRLVCTTQGIDLFNPEEEYSPINVFFANLLVAFAELEREMISTRVKQGQDRAKRQGKKLGRKRIEGAIPAVIERLLEQGCTKEQIAERMGMSITTLYRRMRKLKIGPWHEPEGEL